MTPTITTWATTKLLFCPGPNGQFLALMAKVLNLTLRFLGTSLSSYFFLVTEYIRGKARVLSSISDSF